MVSSSESGELGTERPRQPLAQKSALHLATVGRPGPLLPPSPLLCTHLSSPLPTLLHLSPHQPVAQLRCSVPAPSWSLPHLPTPTGRSTVGKRAPGPPDQTAPAVLLKVRGTQREVGTGGGQWALKEAATLKVAAFSHITWMENS
jgi:hypothetical protein